MPGPWEDYQDIPKTVTPEETGPWSSFQENPKKEAPQQKPQKIEGDFDGVSAMKAVFPAARITSGYRGPNHPLSKKTPSSFHARTHRAVDIRPIPGMSFDDVYKKLIAEGYDLHPDSRDEVTNPSPNATGPHWHFVFNGGPTAVPTSEDVSTPSTVEEPKKRDRPEPYILDKTTTPWDVTDKIPEGYSAENPELRASRAYTENYLQRIGKTSGRDRPTEEQFIAGVRQNAPHVTADDRTLSFWYRHYAAGGRLPVEWSIQKAEPEKAPSIIGFSGEELPIEMKDTGVKISNPPPLTFGERFSKRAAEMLSPAGTGINAVALRALEGAVKTKGPYGISEEDYANTVLDERARREQFWKDQDTRSDSPVKDFLADTSGEMIGDVNPTYAIGGGGGIAGRTAVQVAANAGTDLLVQAAENIQKVRDGYDPNQTWMAAATGAAFQLGFSEPLNFAVNKYKSRGVEVASYDNPRVVEVGDTPSAPVTATKKRVSSKAKAESVGKIVSILTKGWKDSPVIIIHRSEKTFASAEPELYQKVKDDKALSSPGFYDDEGKIHILSHNIKNPEQVKALVYHEALGHSGLAKEFGATLDDVLLKVYEGNWKIREEADALSKKKYGTIYTGDDRLARFTEEVLAKRSENGIIPKKILDTFTKTFRDYGRKLGLDLRYTDREVSAILASAHDRVVSGSGEAVGTSGLKYMYVGRRGSDNYENFKREQRGLPKDELNLGSDKYWEAVDRAERGEPVGPDSQIRKDTGWFVAPDNRWRTEISDLPATLSEKFSKLEQGTKAKLGDLLEHPELFSHYPELRDIELSRDPAFMDIWESTQGWVNEKGGINITPYAEDALGTLLHEVQHVIQRLEGFSTGGNPETVLRRLSPKHLFDVAEKVVSHYTKLSDKLDVKARAFLVAAEDPLFTRYEAVNKKISESYDRGEDVSRRADLIREKGELQTALFEKYTGYRSSLDLKKADKKSYDQMWDLLMAATRKEGLLGEAAKFSQEAEKISRSLRDIRSNLNKDGTVTDRGHLEKVLTSVRDLPMEAYKHLFGEVEARDTTNRMDLTEEERTRTVPYTSEPDIDPTGYVLDNGMAGYGITKSEINRPVNKYMLPEDFGKATKQEIYGALREKYDPLPDTAYTYRGNGYTVALDAIDNPDGKGLRLDRMFKLTTNKEEITGRLSYDWQMGNWTPSLITSKNGVPLSVSEGLRPDIRRETREILIQALPNKDAEGFYEAKKRLLSDNRYMLEEEDTRRAGSIDLNKIITKDGLNTHELYRAFAEGIDKETVSYEDALAAVADAGLTPSKALKKKIEVDPTIGISLAVALEKGHRELLTVQKKLLTGSFKNLDEQQKLEAKAIFLVARQAELQAKVAGWRSNIGRALNFMKIAIDHEGPAMERILKTIDGANLADRDVLYSLLRALDEHQDNPQAKAKLIKDTFEPLPEDYFLSFSYSMMLYSLSTQSVNFVGNAGSSLLDAGTSLVSSLIGLPKKLTKDDRLPVRAALLRNVAMLKALFDLQTWRDVGTSFMEGRPAHQVSKVEVGHNLFTEKFGPAGTAIDLPQKGLAAADSFWRSLLENAHLYEQAFMIAEKEGLKGSKFHDRVSELLQKTPEEISSLVDSNVSTLQLVDDPSILTRQIERLKARPKNPHSAEGLAYRAFIRLPAQIIFPFSRVTDNIVRSGIRHTPMLGMFDRQNLADWKAGGARRDKAIARQIIGSVIISYLMHKADQDELSGEGPENYDRRRALESAGWQPNSIKIGGTWYSLNGLDSIQPMAGVVAGLAADYKSGKIGKDDFVSGMVNVPIRAGVHLSNNTFTEQAGQFIKMLGTGPEADAARNSFVPNVVSRNIPAFVRQYAEDSDGYARDTTGTGSISDRIEGRVMASIPGLREDLPMKYDVYGRPIESNRPMFGIAREKTPDTDPVIVEIERLTNVSGMKGALIDPIDRGNLPEGPVREAGRAEDVQALQKLSGEYLMEDLRKEMETEDWANSTDEERIKTIRKIKKTAREDARADLFPEDEEGTTPWQYYEGE